MAPTVYSWNATNLQLRERIHGFRIGDVKEIGGLRLKLGKRGNGQRDILNLDERSFFKQQVVHHLHININRSSYISD